MHNEFLSIVGLGFTVLGLLIYFLFVLSQLGDDRPRTTERRARKES